MSIRSLLHLLVGLVVPMSALVAGLSWMLGRQLTAVETAERQRYQSYRLAQELIASSERLTAFARRFVVTGEDRYRRHYQQVLDMRNGLLTIPGMDQAIYWQLVLADKLPEPADSADGSASLEKRMLAAGVTLEEFSLLKDAHLRSDKLAELEHRAMYDLMVDAPLVDDGSRLIVLMTEQSRNAAMALLHNHEYNTAKASIMEPIAQFSRLLDTRTAGELSRHNARAGVLMGALLLTGFALLVIVVLIALLLQRRLVRRGAVLMGTVERIAAGELGARTGERGVDELGLLARSIDSMAGRLEQALGEARDHAKELDEQRAHSEKLLNNILPVLIADRLKKGESNIAETFPEVTVLFADLVGFTQLSASISPRQLVHILNDIFGRFDELALEHGLEKIKTIGDCYMVVGGVPERSPTHCQQVARFAAAALRVIEGYNAETGRQLQMRLGIHTGTVVAGIVGKQKYSYDLWGDVVNTASRLEGASLPGRIHVTDAVRARLLEEFHFEPRGPVEIKGKGLMETWFMGEPRTV
jgi:adenylate cyclase